MRPSPFFVEPGSSRGPLLDADLIYLLKPLTNVAHAWVAEHLPADATWWCGAIVVEHRYIGPIIGVAIGDGLVVR